MLTSAGKAERAEQGLPRGSRGPGAALEPFENNVPSSFTSFTGKNEVVSQLFINARAERRAISQLIEQVINSMDA